MAKRGAEEQITKDGRDDSDEENEEDVSSKPSDLQGRS